MSPTPNKANQPMTDEQIIAAIRVAGAHESEWKALTYESGPYEITTPNRFARSFVDAIAALLAAQPSQAQAAEAAVDWISVNDRLPTFPKTVLVAYESDADGEPCLDTGEAILYPDGKWYGMGVFYALDTDPRFEPRMTEKKVAFWKPLPRYESSPASPIAQTGEVHE